MSKERCMRSCFTWFWIFRVMQNVRYDRQVRLWGDDGQSAVENTSVCVLGASSLATETLKNLVLAGIESFCIIDDALVEEPDLGTNFFMESGDVGKPRAEVAVKLLKDLNEQVKGRCILRSPSCSSQRSLEQLTQFSVVVASNLTEGESFPISSFLFARGIPFLWTRSYGLLGCVRVCVREHTILNTHQENLPPDLRLDMQFDELKHLVHCIRVEQMSDEQVRHIPYLLLYAIALKDYKESLSDHSAFPSTSAARKSFLPYVMKLERERSDGGVSENFEQAKTSLARALLPTRIPSSLEAILTDAKCAEGSTENEPFWIMAAALRRFVERNGVIPLSGQLPDMASDSASYSRIAAIYHDKALKDCDEVMRDVQELEWMVREEEDDRMDGEDMEDSASLITREACLRFCRNASSLGVQRGSCLSAVKEGSFRRIVDLIAEDGEESTERICVSPALWLLLLRAVDRFKHEKSRFPGTNGIPCDIDSYDVKARVESIVKESLGDMESSDVELVLKRIPGAAVDEMCRYGACELHGVSSVVGGVTSQEVIKISTRQYTPINNTLVYDAHAGIMETFVL